MNWTDRLSTPVYERLCNCKSLKSDLPELVSVVWQGYIECGKAAKGFTKEDALIFILELLDCNGQFIELSNEEWKGLIE